MSISPYSPLFSSNPLLQNSAPSPAQTFAQLAKALRNGDLSGAQQAFQTLQQDQSSSSTQTSSSSSSPLQSDFDAIGQALSNGDLQGAQKAFAQLRSDIQAAGGQASGGAQTGQVHGHHHHHHHGSSSQTSDDNTTDTSQTDSADGSTSASVVPGSVNLTA